MAESSEYSSEEEIAEHISKRRKNENKCDEKNSERATAEISVNKKRKGRSRKERERTKFLRNTGKEYIDDEKGKTVQARTIKPLADCKMKCKERFSNKIRQSVYEKYWKLGQHDKRSNFLSSLICILEKKNYPTKNRF